MSRITDFYRISPPAPGREMDDDRAFEGDPAAVYGKLVDMGATMIQTDRPELLISYLRSRGLHD